MAGFVWAVGSSCVSFFISKGESATLILTSGNSDERVGLASISVDGLAVF